MNDELLKVDEVARILRVTSTTVRRWAEEGLLDAILLPGEKRRRRVFRREDIVRALAAGTLAKEGSHE